MDTVNVNTDQPIKRDDVVILDDGSTVTASTNEVVINSSESTGNESTGLLPVEEPRVGPFPYICPLHLYQQHSQFRTVYVTDGRGNYIYYYPDGSIEHSTATPREKILNDISSVLLPNAIRFVPGLKKPTFELMGRIIEKFVPQINKGPGIRVGISKSHGRRVFRATYGNRKDHFFDIDLGPIERVKP